MVGVSATPPIANDGILIFFPDSIMFFTSFKTELLIFVNLVTGELFVDVWFLFSIEL